MEASRVKATASVSHNYLAFVTWNAAILSYAYRACQCVHVKKCLWSSQQCVKAAEADHG